MLNLLWYVLIGIGMVIVVAIDELVVVRNRGLSVSDYAEWINSAYIFDTNKLFAIFSTIWGLLLWPLRVIWVTVYGTERRINQYVAYLEETKNKKKVKRV